MKDGAYDWVTGQRDTLPSWVFERQGNGRYVGVSDPCLDSLNGESQAVLRAFFLSMMDEGFNVQIMQEQFEYTHKIGVMDFKNDRFMQYVRFYPQYSAKRFRQGRSYRSLFGETFIEIVKVDSYHGLDNNVMYLFDTIEKGHIVGEYVMNGYENSVVSYKIRAMLNIEAMCNAELHNLEYGVRGVKGDYIVDSHIDGDLVSNKERGRYWYINDGCDITQHELLQYDFELTNGVWCGLLGSMNYNIANGLQYNYTVKSLIESSSDGKEYNLSRLTCDEYASIRLVGYRIIDDKIEAVWDLHTGD